MLTFVLANAGVRASRSTAPELTLCLLVFALTFPGRNRFRENLLAAGVDIVTSWLMLLGILALCGYATRSLHCSRTTCCSPGRSPRRCCSGSPVWLGQVRPAHALRARPRRAARAVVVGAGPLGVKVARSLVERA